MSERLPAFLVLALVGCVGGPSSHETLQISGFRQGVLDMSWPDRPVMTAVGNDFRFQLNGWCIVAGEHSPCMWYGFEFSYESSAENPVLNCTVYFDEPSAVANPNVDYGHDLMQHSWTIRLPGRRGHYLHPEYTAPSSRSERDVNSAETPDSELSSAQDDIDSDETVCLYAGQEVLRFRFTLRYGADSQSEVE
jgi:hypothetical protein